MRFAYADPPYPGMAHMYKDHPDYAGEVDHKALIERLVAEYPDGWALSTSESGLQTIMPFLPPRIRLLSWVQTNPRWHHWGRSGELGFCWEPICLHRGRVPIDSVFNWFQTPWGGKSRGFQGGKPEDMLFWLFRCLGALPGDTLDDLFPGSGAVTRAWDKYQRQITLPMEREPYKQAKLG